MRSAAARQHSVTFKSMCLSQHSGGMYLAKCNPVSIINEEPDCSSIPLSITTGKALVGAVKEHYVVALLCGSSSCVLCCACVCDCQQAEVIAQCTNNSKH
jgi:hypothetical protein